MTYGYGQELHLPVFTQYLADNAFVISPTYAGIGDNFRIRANGLTQWVGIKGPYTMIKMVIPDKKALSSPLHII